MTQSAGLRAFAVIGLAGIAVAACSTTPPPPPPVQQPPVTQPEPEPTPEPEPEPEVRTGLIPPHMADRDLVRVAVLLPFSAENAGARAEALRLLRAAELALFERGSGNLLMIPKDTQGTPEGARATDTTVAGDGVYLMSFPPEIEVARIVEYASRQGVERFAYLGPQDRYGMAVYDALQNSAGLNGGYVAADSFYTGDVEAMARASARLASGVFEPLTPEDALELQRQEWVPDPDAAFQAVILPEGSTRLRALGPLLVSQNVDPLVVRFLGTGLWNDPELLREPALHGGWFAGPDQAARERFETSYREAYDSPPSRIASLAYDAMALAAHLDGGERGFSREAIEEEQGFMGADGLFRFRSDGLIERGLAIFEIRPRGLREIEPAPLSFEPQAF